jgi:hypothetical protein
LSSFPTSVDSFTTKLDYSSTPITITGEQITIVGDSITKHYFKHDNVLGTGWKVTQNADGTGTDYTSSATFYQDSTKKWRYYLTFNANNGVVAYLTYQTNGDENEASDINDLQMLLLQ